MSEERDFDPAADSYGCWLLGISACREISIRKHQILPDKSKPREVEWVREGFLGVERLDSVKGEVVGD
jgi:hypothetical protein